MHERRRRKRERREREEREKRRGNEKGWQDLALHPLLPLLLLPQYFSLQFAIKIQLVELKNLVRAAVLNNAIRLNRRSR